MARTSEISIAVYRRHIALYRFINDSGHLPDANQKPPHRVGPGLWKTEPKSKEKILRAKERRMSSQRSPQFRTEGLTAFSERLRPIPKFDCQYQLRVEAFLIECLNIVITRYPEKLSLTDG